MIRIQPANFPLVTNNFAGRAEFFLFSDVLSHLAPSFLPACLPAFLSAHFASAARFFAFHRLAECAEELPRDDLIGMTELGRGGSGEERGSKERNDDSKLAVSLNGGGSLIATHLDLLAVT